MKIFNGRMKSSGFRISIFDSIELVSEEIWNSANSENDIFLSTDYLKALEKAPPKNMAFKYAILCEGKKPVAVASFQILTLDAGLHESLQANEKNNSGKFSYKVHSKLQQNITSRMLICGNALLCGEHGFAAVPGTDRARLSKGISEAMEKIRHMERSSGKVNILLAKDFYTSGEINKVAFSDAGYYEYSAGPNMTIPIRENWESFNDYLAEMKVKYRSRVTSAMKKGRDIIRKPLSFEEIASKRDELYALYLQVAEKAKFRLFVLNPDMPGEMKRYLKDCFTVDAYYLDEKIIAYTTRIFNGSVVEGYSHGLDYSCNKEYELYQNILIDDIKEGIKTKAKKINYGRTSIAMKSSLGAIPEEAEFFMQLKGVIPNQLIKMISSFFKPPEEHCRNPFV